MVLEKLREQGSKGQVKDLAELTGIPAGNLSQINTGGRDMTIGYARRIAENVPGISPVAHLGAPEAESHDRVGLDVFARLEALEKDGARAAADIRRLTRRVDALQRQGQTQRGRGTQPKKKK